MLSDIRYAWRLLCRDWRFSITLIATLATGIAASGAIFNVANATLLRPLPIPDETQVFRLRDYTQNPGGQRVMRSTRVPNFLSISEETRSFSAVAGMYRLEWSLIDGAAAVPVKTILVTPGWQSLLGAKVIAGRGFTADEEATGLDANVIVVSHALWRQRFGGHASAVGKTIRIEDRVVTIVGVLAPGFRFPYDGEAWMPVRPLPTSEVSLAVFARLAPGVTRQQAQADLDAIATRAEAVRPVANRGLGFAMVPIREDFVGNQYRTTFALMAASILLLLLASANVANLLLVRGIGRAREIAVRMALGAERSRQLRQLLVESVMFAAIGTVVGLALAAPISASMTGLVPNTLRDQLGMTDTTIDWRAAIFAAAVTATCGILAGLTPALRLLRTDAAAGLRQSSRNVSGTPRIMRALVVVEVAIASVLLITAGMMADNFRRLLDADLGLRAEQLISIRLPLPARYDTAERRIALARQLVETGQSIPGTERAGIVSVNPIDRGSFGAAIESEDQPLAPGQSAPVVNHRLVTPDWLPTAGVALLEGRQFTSTDSAAGLPVAIISKRFATRLSPNSSAIGKRIRQARPDAPWITVVGIVADVRDTGEWQETWYVPYEQHAGTLAGATMHLMMRSNVDAATTIAAIRRAVASIDTLLPVPEPTVMATLWKDAQVEQRMGAVTSSVFAASGLLLSALGTFGVLAYLVSSRAREFGIRQAIGASPFQVRALVLRDGAVMMLSGLALGGLLSIAAVRALQGVVTETSGFPTGLGWSAAVVVLAAGMTAAFASARRATAIAPVDVMRSE